MNVVKPVYMSGHNYSFSKENGKYDLSLGNMTDAGWYWSGDKDDLGNFVVRLANSKITQEFIDDANKSGLKFADIKNDVLKAIRNKDSGMYAVSGDNVQWHFGQDLLDIEYEIDEYAKEYNLPRSKVEEVAYGININDYDRFEKSIQFQNLKRDFLVKVMDANDFKSLMSNLGGDFTRDVLETVMEFQSDVFHEEMAKQVKR